MKLLILLGMLTLNVAGTYNDETIYYIATRTSSENYAGSNAISAEMVLVGTTGSVNLGVLDKDYFDEDDYVKGGTKLFTVPSDVDVGQVQCIVISVSEDDAWLFEWVSITSNKDISQETFLYNINSTWMSSDTSEGEAELELCLEDQAVYFIHTKTSSRDHAGSDNLEARIRLIGEEGVVDLGILDNNELDDFERNATDQFLIVATVDIGKINCIQITVSRDDAWLLDEVIVSSDSHPRRLHLENSASTWLSSDLSEGSNSLQLCEEPLPTEPPTLPVFRYKLFIATQTATREHSESDNIRLNITIEGSKGSAVTGLLDNLDLDDFEKGARDVFEVRVTENVGKVRCITLAAGGDDAWEFLWIEVHSVDFNEQSYFYNTENDVMSSDTTEGTDTLKLCL